MFNKVLIHDEFFGPLDNVPEAKFRPYQTLATLTDSNGTWLVVFEGSDTVNPGAYVIEMGSVFFDGFRA